ncbi:hypothetical protein BDR26DRAFT_864112 [Obelidium mucronatum]|nr:hypothetical protein BDR26DRAFT_864112 [Obelidium mucronatum]
MKQLECEKDGICLWRDAPLPKCSTLQEAKIQRLAPRVYTWYSGISDFAFGYSGDASIHRCNETDLGVCVDDLPTSFFLPMVCPAEVKCLVDILENMMDDDITGQYNPTCHSDDILQTASYALYCMLRILPHLTDVQKVEVFGPNISMYALLLTHTCCQIIRVSITGFGPAGRVILHWGDVLRGQQMANALVDFVSWVRDLLAKVTIFEAAMKEPGSPKYIWLPVSEYKSVFATMETDVTQVILASFMNPVIRVGDRVYRLFEHILSNNWRSKIIAAENQRDAAKNQRVAAENQRDAAEKERDTLANYLTQLLQGTMTAADLPPDFVASFGLKPKDSVAKYVADTVLVPLESKTKDSVAKYTAESVLVPEDSFHNPFNDWVFAKYFISMPYYGRSLDLIFEEDAECATPARLKSLFLSVIDKSLLPLESVSYSHMDIRLANVVLSDSVGWSDACLIDYDFCEDLGMSNPMNRVETRYPPEANVHKNSDIWMLGIVLLNLGVCGRGWEKLRDHAEVESWVNAQLNSFQNGEVASREGVFEGALQLAAECLCVNPNERMGVAAVRANVDLWQV